MVLQLLKIWNNLTIVLLLVVYLFYHNYVDTDLDFPIFAEQQLQLYMF